MKLRHIIIALVILVIFLFSRWGAFYTIDETEQVIVTQLGKVVGEPITEPGLNVKIPFIQVANYFPKNVLEWDGKPDEIPTKDKVNISVDTFARWKIVDPLRFYKTLINESQAQSRLDDILDSKVRDYISAHPLIESVRRTNRELAIFEAGTAQIKEKRTLGGIKLGREKLVKGIMEQAQPTLDDFGIELVDLKIKRINYVEGVRRSVYERMISERKQIAEKFRSEGQGEARKIEGQREKDLKQITSEAYKKAQEIKGGADAESTRIYAEAYNSDPEFYSFLKTLDIYRETMKKDSSLVLSTDSDFLRYFKELKEKNR